MKPGFVCVPPREPREGVRYDWAKRGNRGVREHFAGMLRVWHCVDCMAGIKQPKKECKAPCDAKETYLIFLSPTRGEVR